VALSDTKTLFVNVGNAVNLVPIAQNDSYSVAEEGTLNGTTVLSNDSDPDFTLPLTAQLVAGPTNAATFNLNPNGTFTYNPVVNFNGTDSFTYTTRDALGGVSNTATVIINVTPTNDAPIANPDTFTSAEDQLLNGNVLTNDTDVDNPVASLSAQLIAGPANALSFTFNPNGSFSYTPNLNYNGSDRITYVAIDPLGGRSNTATVSLAITPVNDAPIANNDGVYSVGAGGTLSVSATSGVLRNDTDIDSPSLSASVVTNPLNGTVSLNADGSFTYRPTGSFTGTDSFTYRASDGSLTSNLATVTISVATNNLPIANPDTFTTLEDTPLTTGNVLSNDTDPDNNTPLTASLVTQAIRGSVNLNQNGTFTYTPNTNLNGVDSFTYRAIDRLGGTSSLATVTFSVTPVNDAPIANNDGIYTVSAGGTLSVAIATGVLSNDTDVDIPSQTLTATTVLGPSNGTVTLNADGSFTYRPTGSFAGIDSFTYRVSDGSLTSNLATVTVSVGTNNAPVASPDLFTTAEDTLLTTGNVLSNDTDTDNNLPLTASLVTQAVNGSVSLNQDGTFSYLPRLNFSGVDSFTYIARDSLGANSSPATVTFSVTPVNDAPVAGNNTLSVSPGGTLSIAPTTLLANDSDVDNLSLSIVSVSATANGSLTLNPNGTFTYQSNAGFTGSDSFTYRASDGTLTSNLATVTLVVDPAANNAPIATPDTFTTAEDTTLTIGNVLANDSDIDNNLPLTASLVTGPTNSLSFALNSNGTFSYVPRLNFNGTDSFTYIARDSLGANSGLVTVTLSVTPVNDAPISGNDSFTIATTTTLNITTPGVLTNDSDVDSPFLSATVVSQPQGTLSLNPDGSFIYRPQTGFSGIDSFTYRANDGSLNATATVNITVTLPPNVLPIANPDVFTFPEDTSLTTGNVLTNDTDSDGNLPLTASLVTGPTNSVSFALNSDGTFSYVPRLNFNGTDSFTYVTRDSRGGASNTATVTLSVTPVNDAPIANNDTLSVIPGSSLNIAQATLLANDTDVDNTTLSVVTVSTTSFGSLSLNLDGSFTYRPNTGFTGTDSFTYRANDGNLSSANTATVTLVVTPTANNVPIALTDTFTTTEDTTLTNGNVLANDTDIDGHLPLTASLVSGPTNSVSFALNSDGTFTYVPRLNFNGVDSFTYVARDSLGATSGLATVTLSVTTVNDPPVANNDTLTLASGSSLSIVPATLLANDTDVDSTTLSVVSVSATAFGSLTFNPDGTFTYRPNTGFSGTDSFTYRASDGTVSSTNSATVLLSVTVAPNILPIANPDTFTTLEDTSLTVGNVLANDSDPDNNTPLTASLVTQALRGSVTLNTNGTFTYIPNANSNGVDSFTYRAIDSRGGSSTATVTFSVTPVNDLPVATNDTVTVNAGSVLTLTLPGVLANDTDLDGNSLTANLINNVTNGNLVLNGNGSLTYTPTAGFFGSDRFTYVANDGTGNSNTATVSIRVNALPTAQSEAYSVIVNTPLVVNQIQGVLANDTDPDGDSLTASLVNQAGQGNVVLNPNGSFTYTPNAGATGTDTFVYRATDGLANTTATVTLSIRANTPPVANPDPLYRAATNGTLSVAVLNSVLSNDTDAETPNGLTAISVSSTSQGSLNLNSNGTFVYIPQAGFQGTDSFVYRASDGVALSNPVTVSISVSPNTPPVANPNFYSFSDPTLSVVAINGVLTNDSDVDGNPLVASVVTNPARGTLTLNPDGSFVYTPQAGFQGTDSFTYRAFDGIASSTATVSLSVIVNQAPIAQPDVYSAIAGQTLTVTAPGVLANDTDPDGQTLSALGGATQPGNGQLLNFNADGSFVYLPNAGFIGLDSFTYRASDNLSETLQTVTISVTTNGAPIANPDVYSVNQNNLLAISRTAGVLANDTDPNAQSLSATIVSTTNQGSLSLNPDGSFVYTPNAGASGTDSFTYRATDGSFNSTAIVTLSLKSTSTPPIAQNDGGYSVATNSSLNISATNGVLKNDSDPDGDLIRASVVTSPISGGTVTLNANGSFVYQPGTGFQGTDSFTYRATDGLTNSTATVFVTVGGANAAPVVTTPGNQLIAQNTELLIPSGISIADPDAGNNPIQITLSATNGTLTLAGITGLTFTTGDGTADATMTFTGTVAAINTALQNLRFNPTTGFSGAAQITLVANDQGNSGSGGAQTGSGTVTVNVSSGATLVTNINPGSGNASPNNLVSAGNTVFFAATNSGGTELFKSDGTATNTIRVADINLTGSSSPRNLTVIGNTLYFTATNGTLGEELWKTDLTTGTGATLVKDIRSGLSSSSPRNLVNLNGTLFLIATDGSAGGSQLFKSDGTDANTVKVGAGYTNAGNPTVVGNALYFTANNGTQIWKTDGTNAGTVLVKDLGTGGNIANLTAVGNILYFAAKDSNGVELWSSDGTTANTNRVADLNPGAGDANPTNLVNLNGTLYFVAQDNTNTFRLFQKTGAGSVSAGIVLPSGGQPPTSLTVVGNKLFFVVDAGTAASPSLQLWSSDGTTAALVKDINATGNDAIASLTSLNGSLFFVANDGTGFKVFRSDGSATGTVAVSGNFTTAPTNLAAVGNKLYFAGSDTTNGSELWVVQ
jgi:ELWxxDGT repeat protein/VCBS repeat-containing protein